MVVLMSELNDEGNIVAVYGTLKRSRGNNIIMRGAGGEYIKDAYIPFDSIVGGGFPLVKFNQSSDKLLKVELFSVSKKGIESHLDRLEGHPTFYIRKDVVTTDGDNVIVYEIVRSIEDKSDQYHINDNIYKWE